MRLILRRANGDPPSYRVKYEGVEIGSISKRSHHVEHREFWNARDEPRRQAAGDQAKRLFQKTFDECKAGLPTGQSEENLIYKRQICNELVPQL